MSSHFYWWILFPIGRWIRLSFGSVIMMVKAVVQLLNNKKAFFDGVH